MDEEIVQRIEDEEVLKETGVYDRDTTGLPDFQEKPTPIIFLQDIVREVNNRKTANLTKEELGMAKLPVRTNIELADYCKFMGMQGFAGVFETDAQTILATSLSREGFLPKLAVTTQKFSETSLKRTGAEQPRSKWGLFQSRSSEES